MQQLKQIKIFQSKLKFRGHKPPKQLQRTAKLTAKVPKLRRFSTGLVHIFGGSLMESRYGFSLKSGVASAEMCEKSAYFQALSMTSPKIKKDMF